MSRLERIEAHRGEQKEKTPRGGCNAQQRGIRAAFWNGVLIGTARKDKRCHLP